MLIEMHAHVIYGVDDGAQTEEDMQRLLYEAASLGVEHLYCTSHIAPGKSDFPMQRYKDHFVEALRWCKQNAPNLKLHSGAEVLWTEDARWMLRDGKVPAYEGTSLVLLEFLPNLSRKEITQAVEGLRADGWDVMLAHVERYRALRSLKYLQSLREETGLYVQMNARTVFEQPAGFLYRRYITGLLKEGLVDCVSSDAHDPVERAFCLPYAHHWLKQSIGQKQADALCGGNFARLVKQ